MSKPTSPDPLAGIKLVAIIVAAIVISAVLLTGFFIVIGIPRPDEPKLPPLSSPTILPKPTQMIKTVETLRINNCGISSAQAATTSKNITLSNSIALENTGSLALGIQDWLKGQISQKYLGQNIRVEELEHQFDLVAPPQAVTTFTITWIYSTSPGTAKFMIIDKKQEEEINFTIYTNLDADIVSKSEPCYKKAP